LLSDKKPITGGHAFIGFGHGRVQGIMLSGKWKSPLLFHRPGSGTDGRSRLVALAALIYLSLPDIQRK